MENEYFECGCCGEYHRKGETADCRNDDARFTLDDLDRMHPPGDNLFGYTIIDQADDPANNGG